MTEIEGQIERITFENPDNGYTIARVRVPGELEPVTVLGNLIHPAPGVQVRLRGEWVRHPKYGRQFKVSRAETVTPTSEEGIRRYLGSGLVKGIGPELADRIVDHFGVDTLRVIDQEPQRLREVEGIGRKRVGTLEQAWKAQKDVRRLMVFLQEHGVGSGRAMRIYQQYGADALSVVQQNPYRLASDVFGIGFTTADALADRLGFGKDSPQRVQAGLLFVLQRGSEEGHTYLPYDLYLMRAHELLMVDRDALTRGVAVLYEHRKIITDDLNDPGAQPIPNNTAVYLPVLYHSEAGIARRLRAISAAPRGFRQVDTARALEWVEQLLGMALSPGQRSAVESALVHKTVVITGGPGTGKTTVLRAILQILSRLDLRIALAAPTGRAAKRMQEASGWEAKTIHRLLEWQGGGFARNEDRPLDTDLVVVDELSMVDTLLAYQLLRAVPDSAHLVLVGDADQLPSIGAGSVLRDLIASQVVPTITLTDIFRQSDESSIVTNAHRINRGEMPVFEGAADSYFIEQADAARVADIVVELVSSRIPRRFELDPRHDIQVLSPMHRGEAGVGNLNRRLQEVLNPGGAALSLSGTQMRVGDKVMQIRNSYTKDVYNGDVGFIKGMDPETKEALVSFDGREVRYELSLLDELVLAYAATIHKSQGSEYPAVVLPLLTEHYVLLQRTLLYTAVTRARKLVVLVGTRKALRMAISTAGGQERHTLLRRRLTEVFAAG